MSNLFSERMGHGGAFHWFQGVVEDVKDPKALGRCRVRVLGDHTQDKADIPTEMLPWAYPIMPINSAAMNGIGDSPTGLITGSWVFGFYRDGKHKQQPMIMGSFGGIPEDPPDSAVGFNDIVDLWPMAVKLEEPDTNRLARGVKENDYPDALKHDVDIISRAEVQAGMPACCSIWDEPETLREPTYPYNKVWEGHFHPDLGALWGHIEEWDSTPEFERYFRWHKTSHNSLEIFPDGREVRKIYGDSFELDLARKHLRVDGDYKVVIKGNKTEHICGDYWQYIEGKKITIVDEDAILVSHANIIEHSDEDNITKAQCGIHEISDDSNNRVSNDNIRDLAKDAVIICASDEVSIGTGVVAPAVILDIAPTGAYNYTPFDDITLHSDAKNEAPGAKAGDLYDAISSWVGVFVGVQIDFIKIVPGKMWNIVPQEHHTGVNYMPELHVKETTYTKDLHVKLATFTNTLDVCDTAWIDSCEINYLDNNIGAITTLTNNTLTSGSITSASVSTASLSSASISGPTTSVASTCELGVCSGSVDVLSSAGTGLGSGGSGSNASVGPPTCPSSPTPWQTSISFGAGVAIQPDFEYAPVVVPVVPPINEDPWKPPVDC